MTQAVSAASAPSGLTFASIPMSDITLKDGSTRGVYIIVRDQDGRPMNVPLHTLSHDLIIKCDNLFKRMISNITPDQLVSVTEQGFHYSHQRDPTAHEDETLNLWQEVSTSIIEAFPQAASVAASVTPPPAATAPQPPSLQVDPVTPPVNTQSRVEEIPSDDETVSRTPPIAPNPATVPDPEKVAELKRKKDALLQRPRRTEQALNSIWQRAQ